MNHGGRATVFISYSRRDLAFVDRLDAALRARGVETLVDRAAIEIGERWLARLHDLIARSETIVFVISPDSIESKVCRQEVEFGRRLGKRFIPVVARRVDSPSVPEALSELNYVFLDEDEVYEERVDRLVAAIRTDLVWMRTHADLGRLAEEWGKARRPRALLLSAGRLKAAERWIADRPANAPLPTDDTRDLIAASRRAAHQRRNGLTAALALGLVVSLGLAALAYWQRTIAVANETRAIASQQAEAKAREAETAARLSAQRALASAGRAASRLVFDLARGMRGRGLPLTVVADVLGRAETLLDELVREDAANVGLRVSQVAMLNEFSLTYRIAADTTRERATADRALALSRQLVAEDPTAEIHARNLAVSLERAGEVRIVEGQSTEALPLLEEGLVIVERLVAANPSETRNERVAATLIEDIAGLKAQQGEIDAAFAGLGRALAIRTRLQQANPSDAELSRETWLTQLKIGDLDVARRDYVGALSMYRAALPAARRALEVAPAEPDRLGDLALNLNLIAGRLIPLDEQVEAGRLLEEARDLLGRQIQADPSNTRPLALLATVLVGLGDVGMNRRDPAGARHLYEEAVSIGRRMLDRDPSSRAVPRDLARSLARVGDALREIREFGGAQTAYRESLAISERLYREEPTNVVLVRNEVLLFRKLVEILRSAGRPEEACRHASAGRTFLLTARKILPAGLFDQDITAFEADMSGCAATLDASR